MPRRSNRSNSEGQAGVAQAGPPVETPPGKRAYMPAKERRRQIIKAAQKVFAGSSLQGATTRDLARAAEVNIATLFQHFDTKEELFVAAVVEPMLKHLREAHEHDGRHDANIGSLSGNLSHSEYNAAILPWIERSLRTMVDVYPLLAAALFSDAQMGRKLYVEQILPILRLRAEGLRSLVGNEISPELVATAGFGIEFAISMDRFFRNRNDDLSEVARSIRDLIFTHLGE